MIKALHIPIAVVLCCILIVGCNQNELANLTLTLTNAVAVVADLQGNKEIAAKLRADSTLVANAIREWRPGSSPADAIRLVNQLIQDLELLPQNDKYRPFIILALGTAAHIIERLTQGNTSYGVANTKVRITHPPNNEKEFRSNWDAIRASSEDMQQAPIL